MSFVLNSPWSWYFKPTVFSVQLTSQGKLHIWKLPSCKMGFLYHMNISICSNANICPEYSTFCSSPFSLNRFNGDSATWNKCKSHCLGPQNPEGTWSWYACTQKMWEMLLVINWRDAKLGTELSMKGPKQHSLHQRTNSDASVWSRLLHKIWLSAVGSSAGTRGFYI